MAEDDFRTGETGQLPVVVAKSSRIASPITLTISPLTVDEAVASGKPLPPNIPEDNPLSPSRASELIVFQDMMILIRHIAGNFVGANFGISDQ